MARINLIQIRRGTASAWTTANPVMASGEMGWESDTNKVKIGDNATAWNSLPYFAPGGVGSQDIGEVLTEGNDAGALQIKNVGDGSDPQDVVTYAQLTAAISGLKPKDDVRVATTANITLSGAQTIDGVSAIAGDRVLVKDQSTPSENGIYVVAAGAWSRSTDADTALEITGAVVSVEEGTTNGDLTYRQTADGITLGVTAILWQQFGTSVPDASPTTKGKAKLYTTLGTNTDGSIDQNTANTNFGLKVNKAGDTMGGPINMAGNKITSVGDGTNPQDVTSLSQVQSLIVAATLGLLDLRGDYDASGGAYPSSGGSGTAGAILKGDFWVVSVAGTLPTGQAVTPGDWIIAKIDTPGNTQANWSRIESNLTYVPVNKAGDTMSGNLIMGGNKITGLAAGTANGESVRYEELQSLLSDFTTLIDAAPVVLNCNTAREPKGYLETAVNRTLDLQNVRGDGALNLYSAIVLIIKKTTASDIVITLDTGFTNRDLLTDASATSYTLTGAINTYHKLTALVLGQASGAFMWWNYAITSSLSIPLTTGSIFVGVGGVATAKVLGGGFDASTGTVSLAALGITAGKIAAGAVTFVKMLGPTGVGEKVLTHDNAGAVAGPYDIVNGTITDSTVIAALLLETSWAGDTKTISNTLEGQRYKGTGSTGVTYFYYCTVDGTVVRTVTGEGVPIDSIQIPPCTEVTGTSASMAKNNAYVANNASRVSLLLPASAAVGDIVEVTGKGAGGWRITQAAGQTIRHATNTTTGTGGYIESNAAQYSAVKLKCITANTDWVIQNVQGAITTV